MGARTSCARVGSCAHARARARLRPASAAAAAPRAQASTDAANLRAAKEVESRLRAEARRRAVAHQGELVTHARLVKESQMAGMLNENYMNEADKLYNANLVRAVLQYESTGKLTPNLTVPM